MTSRYRIDRFTVPAAHRIAFLDAVAATHDVLRAQPGFRRDLIVGRDGGDEILTLAEWAAEADVEAVAATVRAAQRARGFDPQAALRDWQVRADLAWFRPL